MDIKQITETPINEHLNERIAVAIMGYTPDMMQNLSIYIPNYSGDRNWAASVVENMMKQPPSIRDKFVTLLNEFIQGVGFSKIDEMLLVLSPDVLCHKALESLTQYQEKH